MSHIGQTNLHDPWGPGSKFWELTDRVVGDLAKLAEEHPDYYPTTRTRQELARILASSSTFNSIMDLLEESK